MDTPTQELQVNKQERVRVSRRRAPALVRFFRHISPEPNTGCWFWTSETVGNGYGRLRIDGKDVFAHRFSYQTFHGEIPAGLQIDHLCRQPAVSILIISKLSQQVKISNEERVLRKLGKEICLTMVHKLKALSDGIVRIKNSCGRG